MKLNDLCKTLEEMAPLHLAEAWDNVGLLAGDPEQEVGTVLATIDLTAEVFAEAQKTEADLILAYHPPIWEPLKRVVAGCKPAPLVYDLIRAGMAVYSFHTALDVAAGGVNDMLAEAIGIEEPHPLQIREPGRAEVCKVIVFVPEDDLAAVSEAMFAAGAGHIGSEGKYSKCSYRTEGTGTFQCGSASAPHIGVPGSFEQVKELRLETVAPTRLLGRVIQAMIAAHPYEEPAYDIFPQLEAAAGAGLGRCGRLKKPLGVPALIETIKEQLKVKTVGVIGPKKGTVKRAAVCAGSCGKILKEVIRQECDFYLTGELSHHYALELQAAGVTTVCVNHSNSERPVLGHVAGKLRQTHPDLTVKLSRQDRDPFQWQ